MVIKLTAECAKKYAYRHRDQHDLYLYRMSKDDDIVTFETFYDPILAEIIRAKLEANGIPCFLADENMGSIYPMYNQGGGGIKLKVFERDLEKCREIVADNTEQGDENF